VTGKNHTRVNKLLDIERGELVGCSDCRCPGGRGLTRPGFRRTRRFRKRDSSDKRGDAKMSILSKRSTNINHCRSVTRSEYRVSECLKTALCFAGAYTK